MGREGRQPFGRGAFQVDGDAIGQLHGAPHLVILGARHDLEMDVAAIAVLFAQNLGGVDDLVLRLRAALDDPGGKKESFHQAGALDGIVGFGPLVGRVGDALRLAAPGAEGTVEAVTLARRGHHRLEDRLLPRRRGDVGDAGQRLGCARLGRRRFGHGLVAGRLELRGVVE